MVVGDGILSPRLLREIHTLHHSSLSLTHNLRTHQEVLSEVEWFKVLALDTSAGDTVVAIFPHTPQV